MKSLYCNKTSWIVLFILLLQNVVEKPSQDNSQLIKITLPNKSTNLPNLRKFGTVDSFY